MFVANKKYDSTWKIVSEASAGGTFMIQPLYKDLEYIVLDRVPKKEEQGGIIPAKAQLMFKKVDGDLYIRDFDGLGPSVVCIERVENE